MSLDTGTKSIKFQGNKHSVLWGNNHQYFNIQEPVFYAS